MTNLNLTRDNAVAFISSLKTVLSNGKLSTSSFYPLLMKYYQSRPELVVLFPEIYQFLPTLSPPSIDKSDYGDYLPEIESYLIEIDTFLEMWVSSNSTNTTIKPPTRRVFLSHGRNPAWRVVQEYIERTLEIRTLELAQESNKGRTSFQKLIEESENCSYAVVIMTGEDFTTDEQSRARENVIHEIGYFQGKYGADRVCLLHEEGVNIPTNIQGVVYIPFPKDGIASALGGLTRELKHL